MSAETAESLLDCRCKLGEGLFWDARDQVLWWVDVPMPSVLHRYKPANGAHDCWPMSEMITTVVVRDNHPGLLIASHGGLNYFDPDVGTLERIVDPEPYQPFNRSNDGAADAKGRFWLGTMQNNLTPDGGDMDIVGSTGALHRFEPDGQIHRVESDIGISNTVCWSPDATLMYFCDTMTGAICVYDFELEAGSLSNKREFARFDRGHPDGSTVDADGFLWNARWDGGCVVRFSPSGEVDRIVEVPASQVTNCTFGGPDLSTLYITTARHGLSDAQLEQTPLAGNIFSLKTDVTGMPDNRFGG